MPSRKGTDRGWVYRWREIDHDTGKTVKRTSGEFRTQKAAAIAEAGKRKELRDLRERRRSGLPLPFVAVVERWQANRAKKGRSPGYLHNAVTALKRVAEERGWRTVEEVTSGDVDDWNTSVPGTNKNLDYLRAVLRFAKRVLKQPIDTDVLWLERTGGGDRQPPDLHSEQAMARILAAFDALGDEYGTLVRHLALYGPRPITISKLTVGDWNLVGRLLTLRKMKNGRTIAHPVHGEMADRLTRLCAGRASDEPLYRAPGRRPKKGQPAVRKAWSVEKGGSASLRVWFRRIVLGAGLPPARCGTNLVKDYAISRMDAAGIADRTKTLFTGHADLRSLANYKATNREQADQALALIPALPSPETAAKPGEIVGDRMGDIPTVGDTTGDIAAPGAVRKRGGKAMDGGST